jgi:hypothetical protein
MVKPHVSKCPKQPPSYILIVTAQFGIIPFHITVFVRMVRGQLKNVMCLLVDQHGLVITCMSTVGGTFIFQYYRSSPFYVTSST